MPPLFHYLSRREFAPIQLHPKFQNLPPNNTKSDRFIFRDIPSLVPKRNLPALNLVVDDILQDVDIKIIEPPTPPEVIRSELHFQTEVMNRMVIPYVRRAIKVTNPTTATNRGCWVLDGKIWPGDRLEGKPDVAFIDWAGELCDDDEIGMRFPLEVKLSSSWSATWNTSVDADHRQAYRQVGRRTGYCTTPSRTSAG